MEDSRKFVVAISFEGWLVGSWISKNNNRWTATEDLSKATTFDSVAEAHKAMGEFGFDDDVLGYEVKAKGLCNPNPC